MPAEAEIELDQSTNGVADKTGPDEWDKRFAADEQDFAAEREQRRRDAGGKGSAKASTPTRADNGQFLSAENGQRAGQATGSKNSKDAAAGAVQKSAETVTGTDNGSAKASSSTGAAEVAASGLPEGQGKPTAAATDEDESKLSPYERAKRRESKTWKQINEAKAALELEKAEVAAERSRIQAERGRPAAPRYTPAQFLEAAGKFEARARELEAAGKFDEADRDLALARTAREEAAKPASAPGTGGGSSPLNPSSPLRGEGERTAALAASWQGVKAAMPELLDPTSAINRETVALIRANPGLLSEPGGPYVAVLRVLRSMGGKLEVEAGKVPGLTKQVEALTKQVAELRALTSLPGGGGPTSRGGGGSEDFASLSTAQQEAQLRRDIEALRG